MPKIPVIGSSRPDHTPITWSTRIPGPRDPLPAQVEDYLEWLRVLRNRPMTTVRAYRQELAKFVAYLSTLVDVRSPDMLEALDRGVLRRYQVQLADVLPNPRSRARSLVALRSFLNYAYDEGWTSTLLSRQIVLPGFVMGDPHPIRTEDVPRMLAALDPLRDSPNVGRTYRASRLRDARDRAIVAFLLASGCRVAEALALNRDDVRLQGFRVLGKGGKYRTVYITDRAMSAVRDYLRVRGQDLSPALWISVARKDRPGGITRADNGCRRAFTALRARMSTDAESFRLWSALRSPHVARHTAATTLLEATNGDVRLVQEVLGHATLETLKVYTEITDRRKREAYSRLSDYLAEVAARV